jgi:hypothetical protein
MSIYSTEERKELEIASAKVDLTQLQAMKILVTNNDLGAEIHIAGMIVGVSVNERLLPVINAEIEEIEKFLRGELNNYE